MGESWTCTLELGLKEEGIVFSGAQVSMIVGGYSWHSCMGINHMSASAQIRLIFGEMSSQPCLASNLGSSCVTVQVTGLFCVPLATRRTVPASLDVLKIFMNLYFCDSQCTHHLLSPTPPVCTSPLRFLGTYKYEPPP